MGEILWVTAVAFIIVAEILIHYAAALNYWTYQNYQTITTIKTPADYASQVKPLLQLPSVLITFGLFIVAQVLGILVMYNKVLKLRPIVALRIIK